MSDKVTVDIAEDVTDVSVTEIPTSVTISDPTNTITVEENTTTINIAPVVTTVTATEQVTTVDISENLTTVGIGDASITASSLASTIQTSHDSGSWITGASVQASFDNLATTADSRYVNVTGDTMTGDLTVPALKVEKNNGTAFITLHDSTDDDDHIIYLTGLVANSTENIFSLGTNSHSNQFQMHSYLNRDFEFTFGNNRVVDPVATISTSGLDVAGTITATSFIGNVTGQVSDLSNHNTSDLSEGTNLYYTTARFDTAFEGKSTSDLSEGTNLYYTTARFDTAFEGKSTSDLSEGTNEYYTSAKADARVDLQTGSNLDLSQKSTSDLSEGTNEYYTSAKADARVNSVLGTGVDNIVTTGYLRGPSTFTIDPAGHGDNTGKVVIAGDLQVDGTTTTINSTTVSVEDKNILLAEGAGSAIEANGAGILIAGAGLNLAYGSFFDELTVNKSFKTTGYLRAASIKDTSGSLGTAGQALLSTGTGTDWGNISTTLGGLTDVDATTGLANGKILKYNGTASEWQVADDAGGIALTDISVSGTEGTASGDGGIGYDNTTGVFQYTPPTAAGIGSLTSVNATVTRKPTSDAVFNVYSIGYNASTGVTSIQTNTNHGFGTDDHIRIFDTSGDMTEGDYGPVVVQHYNYMTVTGNMGVPSDASTVSYQKLSNTDPLLKISDSEGNFTNIEFAGTNATSVERSTDNKIIVNNSYNDDRVDAYLARDPDTLTSSVYDKDLLWLSGNDVTINTATYATSTKYTGQGISTHKKQSGQSYVAGEPFNINGVEFDTFSPHISKSSALDIKAGGTLSLEADSSSGTILLKPGTSGLRVERSNTSIEGVTQTLAFHTTDNGIHVGNDRRGTYTAGDLQSNADLDFGMLVGRESTNTGSNNFGFGFKHSFGTGTASNFATGSVHQCNYSGSNNNFFAGADNRLESLGDNNVCGGVRTSTRNDLNFSWGEGVVDGSNRYAAKNYGHNCVLFGKQTSIDTLSQYSLIGGDIHPTTYDLTKIRSGKRVINWGLANDIAFSNDSITVGHRNNIDFVDSSAIFGSLNTVTGTNTSNRTFGLLVAGDTHDIKEETDYSLVAGQNHTVEGKGNFAVGLDNNSIGEAGACIGKGLKTPLFQPVGGGDYVWDDYSIVVGGFNDEAHKYYTNTNNTAWVEDHRFVVGTGTASNAKDNGFIVTVPTSGFSGIIMPKLASSPGYTNDLNAKAGGVPVGGLYHNNGVVRVVLDS